MHQNIVVIIATSMNRTSLLLKRSLPSVLRQTCLPKAVIIVDDNCRYADQLHSDQFKIIQRGMTEVRKYELCKRLKITSNKFSSVEPYIEVIPNSRTVGNSGTGAWNTGAMRALTFQDRNEPLYIAFLDDDDEWKDTYLERCYHAVKNRINFSEIDTILGVFASFIRKTECNKVLNHIDECQLNPESFFIGNPGIQGSNIFIDIQTFWEIEGFDERFPSTTDRDFAIRLFDHLKTRQGNRLTTISDPLVIHHAHNDPRVTTDISKKHQGLDLFYEIYGYRMTKKVLEASLQRAYNFFGYKKGYLYDYS